MTGRIPGARFDGSTAEAGLRAKRLLITAALAAAPQARDAWQLWTAEFTLDALDGEVFWILPMLYSNLLHCGVEYAERPRLAGVYKQLRLRNAIAHRCLQEVLESLLQRQCEVLPGAITSLVLCGEEAIPLDPVELLVPVDALELAHSVLQSCGWKPALPLPPPLLLPFVSAVRYRHAKAGDLVLCWRPYGLDCPVEYDASLWRRSGWDKTGTCTIRLADPVDRLLMTVQKGYFLHVCVMLHRTFPEVTGPALADRVKELGLAPLWAGLTESLTKGTMAGIPASLIQAQSRHIAFSSPPDSRVSLFQLAKRHWQRYRRCPASLRPSGFIAYLLHYYRYAWQCRSFGGIVSKALKQAGSRFIGSGRKVPGC